MVKGLAHVCFRVRDLDASVAFYRDVLGLQTAFAFRREDGQKFGQYFHVGGRTFLELFRADRVDPRPEHPGYSHFCLEVDDIRATVKSLEGREVEVSPVVKGSDHSWQAWLSDPDGNRIELHEYTDDSGQAPYLS